MRVGESRRSCLIALVAAAAFTACATQSQQGVAIARARADAEAVHRSSGAPALAVAVVSGDRIVWQEALGLADVARNTKAGPRSVFRIGSVTKLFTGVALARLAEHGTVQLTDSAQRYVVDFPEREVTLEQLARHLSGVRHYSRSEYVNTESYPGVADSLGKFANDALLARPGEKYVYSSYGYNLLGAALEKASGTPFPQLLTREVFQPFGMRDTFASPATEVEDRVVTFYGKDRDGVVAESIAIDLSDRLPSGGYLSTAPDLGRFLRGVFDLPPAVRTLLFESGHTRDGKATNVGLAWRIATDDRGRSYVHHGGESIGGRAFVLAYPEQRVGVVILANLSFAPFGEKEALRIASHFLPAD